MTDSVDQLIVDWWKATTECNTASEDLVAHNKLYTEALNDYCVIDKSDGVADSSWYYDVDTRMWKNDLMLTREQKRVSEQKRFQNLVAAQQRVNATQNALLLLKNRKKYLFRAIARVGLPRRLENLCNKLKNVVPAEMIYFVAAVVSIRGADNF